MGSMIPLTDIVPLLEMLCKNKTFRKIYSLTFSEENLQNCREFGHNTIVSIIPLAEIALFEILYNNFEFLKKQLKKSLGKHQPFLYKIVENLDILLNNSLIISICL